MFVRGVLPPQPCYPTPRVNVVGDREVTGRWVDGWVARPVHPANLSSQGHGTERVGFNPRYGYPYNGFRVLRFVWVGPRLDAMRCSVSMKGGWIDRDPRQDTLSAAVSTLAWFEARVVFLACTIRPNCSSWYHPVAPFRCVSWSQRPPRARHSTASSSPSSSWGCALGISITLELSTKATACGPRAPIF